MPDVEKSFIFDSYACRLGKGTHRAVRRAQHFSRLYPYFVRTDIVKFFPNIDHQVLLRILQRKIRDRSLSKVVCTILDSGKEILKEEASQTYFPGDDLFAVCRDKGLPIGNLTSQFFANVYLDQLDHFVKEGLRLKGYVRYADDFVFFGDDKTELWQNLKRIADFLQALRLRLHQNKTILGKTCRGFNFLGFRVQPASRRLQQSGLRRFNRNLRRLKWEFNQGALDAGRIRQSLNAWQGHASFANTVGIQKSMASRIRFKRTNG